MVDYLSRSAWGARPPKGGPGSLTPSRVQGTVVHWPGTASTTGIHSKAAVASALRGWQAYHMDTKDWSDIAYQVAVDQEGRAWTLRGLRTQSGANGNADLNERYCAILLVLIDGEEPSAAMKATVREVIADVRRLYPNASAIRPHSAVRPDGTDCPGDEARACIARGDFTPDAEPTTPNHPEDDMPWTEAQLRKMMQDENEEYGKRLWGAPTGTGTALLKTVTGLAEAVAALTKKLTAEDVADDAEFRASMVKLDATLAELKVAIETPPDVPAPKA